MTVYLERSVDQIEAAVLAIRDDKDYRRALYSLLSAAAWMAEYIGSDLEGEIDSLRHRAFEAQFTHD